MRDILTALLSLTMLGPGSLAAADPGVLEGVQETRVKHGYRLYYIAPLGSVLAAVDNCDLIGRSGILITRDAAHFVRVVDCTNAEHMRLEDFGLLADVSAPELNHKTGVMLLWE